MRIIVAADTYLDREILANTTRKAGYADVETCSSGQQVLERVENHAVDVVIADKHLGDIDAVQLTSHLGSDLSTGDPSVIIFADEFRSDEAISAIRAGAANLLIKPVLPDQLGEKLKELS